MLLTCSAGVLPVLDTLADALETPVPVLDTSAPVLETPIPVLDTPAPVLDTRDEVLDTPVPVLYTLPEENTPHSGDRRHPGEHPPHGRCC